jgi:15-cis-phytoene synthase
MIELFNTLANKCSQQTTIQYSTSFYSAIKLLHKSLRQPIYNIYGFVRLADEIVDSFHNYDKAFLLQQFKQQTYQALEQKISLNPILHSFQYTVNEYKIPHTLIEDFFISMQYDLDKKNYTEQDYKKYIYGSAEVVGLMCLYVFCQGNTNAYNNLKTYAQSLGAAFQKVNFLRDIQADTNELGRMYFPGCDFNNFTIAQKKQIEADIQNDFNKALQGIKQLPTQAKLGVYVAGPVDEKKKNKPAINTAKAYTYTKLPQSIYTGKSRHTQAIKYFIIAVCIIFTAPINSMNKVILVNEHDQQTGEMDKMEAHEKNLLHRAFSIFIFNPQGKMLLQQRAKSKYHSGGLWTNACCSHPMPGETTLQAANRRLMQEMGFTTKLTKAFSFTYNTSFSNGLHEHEYDHVYTGVYDAEIIPDTDEVMNYCYKTIPEIQSDIAQKPAMYTEWFKIALPKLIEYLGQSAVESN